MSLEIFTKSAIKLQNLQLKCVHFKMAIFLFQFCWNFYEENFHIIFPFLIRTLNYFTSWGLTGLVTLNDSSTSGFPTLMSRYFRYQTGSASVTTFEFASTIFLIYEQNTYLSNIKQKQFNTDSIKYQCLFNIDISVIQTPL